MGTTIHKKRNIGIIKMEELKVLRRGAGLQAYAHFTFVFDLF